MAGPGLELVGEEEEQLVLEALRSRQLSRYRFDDENAPPSMVFRFERELESYLAVKHCLGTNSCTSALFCALTALGVGPGDEVLVPGYTFIATMAAVAHARAVPVLCEIDDSLTLDPEHVRAKITPRTRGIIAVHMLGAPCDMAALRAIADEHGLFLIEDVAQACGGSYRGKRLGSWGDAGAFSLNVFKTITAGDGGVLALRDTAAYERAFALHDHGSRPLRLGVAEGDAILGLNLRMHELTGAVALAQLRKLDGICSLMHANKALLLEAVGDLPHARGRRLNDAKGECATLAVWLFDTPQRAQQVATVLGCRRLIESGKHYYGNMPQLLRRAMPHGGSCPFSCSSYPTSVRYSRGQLPRTDDLLARAVAISVGVSDSYLGSSFGVRITSTPDEIATTASELRRRVEGILQ
jgi:dTDP-4-amino-4,6-dideoxygalactose transaminase